MTPASIIFLCQICVALFVGSSSHSRDSFYDTDMIVNMTLSFVSAYKGSCVRFISEDDMVEDHTTFEIYKRISIQLYKTVAVYPYTKYSDLLRQNAPRKTCFKPIKLIIDGEGMREKLASATVGMSLASYLIGDWCLLGQPLLRSTAIRFGNLNTTEDDDPYESQQREFPASIAMMSTSQSVILHVHHAHVKVKALARVFLAYLTEAVLEVTGPRKFLAIIAYGQLKVVQKNFKSPAILSYEVNMSGSLWLIIMKGSIVEYFSELNLPFDVEVIIAHVITRDLVEFNEAYRVDHGYPLRIKPYGQWTRSEGLNIPLSNLYSRRSDLEGKLLRTGSIENWPMSSFKGGKWDGYFPRIWNEVAGLINATTQAYKSRDGATGSAKSDGSWSGLVGMILDGSIDVIVAEMSINMERSKVVTFSRPVLTTRYKIYFTSPGRSLKWDAAFTPFGRDVWIALLMWIVIGTLSMALCYDCSWYCGVDAKTKKILGVTESFFFVLQSLCQQGYPDIPRSTACRIIIFSCFLVSSVLIPSYSAAVISSLTYENPYRPFETLEQMLEDGSHKLLVIPNSGQYDYFKHSPDPLHQAILHKLIWTVPQELQVKNIEDALNKAFCRLKKYAFFSTEKIFEMKTEYNPLKCSLVALTQELSPVYQGLVLKKYSPFSGVINHHLQRLYDIGVINRVENSIRRIQNYNFNHFFIDVDAEDSFQMFFLLSCGFILSLILFSLEKIYYRSRHRRTHGALAMMHQQKQGRLPRKEYPIPVEFYTG